MSVAPPLSLYIHLPWCIRKCPYCDFNSHALRGELPAADYVDALLADAEQEAKRAGRRSVSSIFLGGGTPSLFPPAQIERLLKGLRQRLAIDADAEITLEANPGTVDQSLFAGFRAAGVNRLSIGIQSFAPEQLQKLGRIHGRNEARAAAGAARAAGFDNFNLDLMFGLPGQSIEAARADLEQAIELGPSHISYYQLTLEPNTLFHARPPRLPDDDSIFEMQLAGQELLARHGYEQYEVSAYAQPGRRCRHNLNYWLFGDYLAIGAGAHAKVSDHGGVRRYAKLRHPRRYMDNPAAVEAERLLAPSDLVLEFMMNALRLNEGFSIALCEARTGLPWSQFEPAVARACEQGLLERRGESVRPTAMGRRYLNHLLELFVPD